MIEIIVAKSAGFCFGVNNAVNLIYKMLDEEKSSIYTLGPIIHNEQVVNFLKSKGVKVVNNINEVEKNSNVVIRAHGVIPSVYDIAQEKEIFIFDATCPYVKKIHDLVNQKYKDGYKIIIVGDKNHPEVIGINGWCNNSGYIINELNEAKSLDLSGNNICVVAQTTLNNIKWDQITELLKSKFDNLEIFNTICYATIRRQKEADEISKSVDIMFVIGGKDSSNTQKLFEICIKHCKRTYKIETSEDININEFNNIKKIGITAGASTPKSLIEEVIDKMSKIEKNDESIDFAKMFEESLVTLNHGKIVKGKVIRFNDKEVFIDLGYKSDGIIVKEELTNDQNIKISDIVNIGDEISVYVLKVNDGEGNVLLSKKKVDSIKGFEKIKSCFEKNIPIEAKIVDIVLGGVIAYSHGVKIFIPASMVSDKFVTDLNEFLNMDVTLKLIEFNKNKIVGSVKAILQQEKTDKLEDFWHNIEVGKVYTGTVKKLMDFGAFIDLGGIDGLVHISELGWKKINHPSEVLNIGDKIEVYVISFDKVKNKVSLSYRKKENNPWNKVKDLQVGDIVEGKVLSIKPFGVFVEIFDEIQGLVHISQVSDFKISKLSDILEIGQIVKAKIMQIDIQDRKLSLSIKEVSPLNPPRSKNDKKTEENSVDEITEHQENMNVTIQDVIGNIKK